MKAKSAPSSSLPLLDVSLQGKGRGHLAASAPLSLQLPGGASWGRGRQGDPKEVLSRGLGAGWPLRRGRPPSAGLQRHYRAGAHRASRRMCRPGPAPDSAPAVAAGPVGARKRRPQGLWAGPGADLAATQRGNSWAGLSGPIPAPVPLVSAGFSSDLLPLPAAIPRLQEGLFPSFGIHWLLMPSKISEKTLVSQRVPVTVY